MIPQSVVRVMYSESRVKQGYEIMQGEKKERWMELAERATVEQDPVEMLRLITEINQLLMEKQQRLVKRKESPNS
jgi:hypothetical protein